MQVVNVKVEVRGWCAYYSSYSSTEIPKVQFFFQDAVDIPILLLRQVPNFLEGTENRHGRAPTPSTKQPDTTEDGGGCMTRVICQRLSHHCKMQ